MTPLHVDAEGAALQLRRGLSAVLLALLLTAFAAHELPAGVLSWAALRLGLPAIFFGARVALDAAVFQRWAGEADLDAAMARFDQQLTRWKLRPAAAPTRSLHSRIDGALRLRRVLFACVAVQAACAAGAWLFP